MQTQNIQLSEILDTIEEMGDLSESAMEAARARQEVLAKPTGALGRLEDISIQLAGITGKVKNNMQKQAIVIMSADNGVVSEGVASAPQSVTLSQTINFTRHLTGVSSMAKYFGIDLLVIDVGVKMPIPEALYAPEMTEHVCADVCCQTGLTQKIVNRRIADGTLLEVVQKVPVKKGDVFFIPPGTLHAIGPGILLAEVQQNSNVTYRIYDYGRLDTDGKPRQLHVEKALEVTNLSPAANPAPISIPLSCQQDRLLACCPYFAVVYQRVSPSRRYNADAGSFHALMCVEGEGLIQTASESFPIPAGSTLFVPADSSAFTLSGNLSLLDVFVPDPSFFSSCPKI